MSLRRYKGFPRCYLSRQVGWPASQQPVVHAATSPQQKPSLTLTCRLHALTNCLRAPLNATELQQTRPSPRCVLRA